MNLEHYAYLAVNENRAYRFYSDGPNGRIEKLVLFTKISDTEPALYNLAFGDVHPVTGELEDKIKRNNQDRDIVLATVAHTVVEFYNNYDNPYIYAEGSTPGRTRLYQMGIAGLWGEIDSDFDVFGLHNEQWYRFERGSFNYDAFLLKRK